MSPKETYIEMVTKMLAAKNYDEMRALKMQYYDKALTSQLAQDANADDAALTDEDKNRLFNFDKRAPIDLEMAQQATEKIDGDEAVLELPNNAKVFMVLENNNWKYSIQNEIQGISNA